MDSYKPGPINYLNLLTGIKAIRKVMEHIFFHMSGAQKINGVNLQEIFGLKNLLQALG